VSTSREDAERASLAAGGRARTRPVRVVVAKAGLDGHDRGAKIVARGLSDRGVEVIYLGVRHTPEELVETALQEDADAIGVSVLSGAHQYIFGRVADLMRAKGMHEVLLFGGGIIPERDIRQLEQDDVGRIFGPGSSLDEIATYVYEAVRGPKGERH
jgi:methylmalonyl-CoA mutase C-terminal domain/subunit